MVSYIQLQYHMRRVALNLVGRQPNTLQAIYDITEYLYADNIPYHITNNKSAFFHAASAVTPDKVIINACNLATYESLCHLNEKSAAASTHTLNVCNLLIFPKGYCDGDSSYGLHKCNNIYLGMYYLDDKYYVKYHFIHSILHTQLFYHTK